MTIKEILRLNKIMMTLVVLTSAVCLYIFTGISPIGVLTNAGVESRNQILAQINTDLPCTSGEVTNFGVDLNPNLSKLKEFEEICGSKVSSELMIFTTMPLSTDSVIAEANRVSVVLQEFAEYNIRPIVIVEPSDENGLINFVDFAKGSHEDSIKLFFETLKSNGISENQMGVWVPFPEVNVPNWDWDGDVVVFGGNFNKYIEILQSYYPNTKASVLLNSASYEPSDTNWEEGKFSNLTNYTAYIEAPYLESVGIQGFPWVSAIDENVRLESSSEFLQPDLAVDLARENGVNKIWFNTGSFGQKYTGLQTQKEISPSRRKYILNSILITASGIENTNEDLKVLVNIFAEDKSLFNEKTDWSYTNSEENQDVIRHFVRKASTLGIDISLFDR